MKKVEGEREEERPTNIQTFLLPELTRLGIYLEEHGAPVVYGPRLPGKNRESGHQAAPRMSESGKEDEMEFF